MWEGGQAVSRRSVHLVREHGEPRSPTYPQFERRRVYRVLLGWLILSFPALASETPFVPQEEVVHEYSMEELELFKNYHHPRFKRFSTRIEKKLQPFVLRQIEPLTQEMHHVFYPFGGPDILYPLVLFSQADTYVLVGLEPVRNPKTGLALPSNLNLQLDSLLRRSFFVTSEMGRHMQRDQGILPLLLAQLSLIGSNVTSAKVLRFQFGRVLDIRFDHNQKEKRLLYVQTDLSNVRLSEDFLNFIKKEKLIGACLLKASSYALHQSCFSKIRRFILDQAEIILQDDTGIPLRSFSEERYKIRVFGNYEKPYGKEWAGYAQKDLQQLFKDAKKTPPISFCYGYGCGRVEANLLLAAREKQDSDQ